VTKPRIPNRWPPPEILERAVFVKEAGPARFVDTMAAARYLALDPHTLECYRSRGDGPAYYKFGKWVRYAVDDLDAWIAASRFQSALSRRSRARTCPR